MQHIPMFLLTLVTLAAAVYVHYRLPFHSGSKAQLRLSRSLLVLMGTAFGVVNVLIYPVAAGIQVMIFLSSFGVVHVPAAFILFIKRRRHEWK